MAEQAKGVCPECGRTIAGRAVGIERAHADRRHVALQPHRRTSRGGPVCLARGGYRVVPRTRTGE